MIINADCVNWLKSQPDNSITTVVTDPPYGLKFMSKKWDYDIPSVELWAELLRVIKPGGMMLCFGGSRTYHRLTCRIEDAGWEIRDCIMWIYGSGFPKSHNHFGIEGYGTALKPAYEPILICNKPYEISHLFAIILLDITNEVYQCQKLNYNVEDAETNLSDSLLLLDKVQQFTVQDHAKIYAWEKLADVQYVIKNGMSLVQELNEKINLVKEFFVHIHVKQNGSQEETRVNKILAGEEECIFAAIQGIVTFVKKEHIEQNIVLLWKHILVGIFQGMNKFTIRTVINLITELRILKSCLHPTTLEDIGNLYPKYEPIILAMKPLDGTYAQNVEKWGIGGINIDECRIGLTGATCKESPIKQKSNGVYGDGINGNSGIKKLNIGRWPANIIFDEEAAELLDQQSGILHGAGNVKDSNITAGNSVFNIGGMGKRNPKIMGDMGGGASRFFYCAKASPSERNAGLEGMPLKNKGVADGTKCDNTLKGCGNALHPDKNSKMQNHHPTVKPLKLMEYLIKLVMPPEDGLLLDPFAGSGTTILAAQNLGFNAIGIEREKEYCEIAEARLKNGDKQTRMVL